MKGLLWLLGLAALGAALPESFDVKGGYLWKARAPMGKSSPVVSGGRVFLTGLEGKQLLTLCYDLKTGKELWRRGVEQVREEKRNRMNHPAAPTPVTDGKAVYSFFADFGLVAYTVGGDELWRVPLGPFENEHGMAASPALGADAVFVQADVANGAFLAAFDKKSGKEKWRRKRRSTIGAYASPAVARIGGGPEVVITSGPFELAAWRTTDGEKLWWVTGVPFQPKSAPVVAGDVVYMNSNGIALPWPDYAGLVKQFDKNGDGKVAAGEVDRFFYVKANYAMLDENRSGMLDAEEWDPLVKGDNAVLAVKIKGTGDQTANVLWKYRKSLPETPRPLVVDGLVYMVRDGGIFTALDAATGEVAKQGRLRNAIDQYFASPVSGDGKVYVSSAAGTLTVLKGGRDWEILSTSDFDEGLWATPAVAGSDIIVRAGETLYCFRGGAARTVSRAAEPLDVAQFARLAGKYRVRPGNELTVAVEDGMVVVNWFRSVIQLKPLGGLEFRTKQAVPGTVRFVEDGGAVKRMEMETQGGKMAAERLE